MKFSSKVVIGWCLLFAQASFASTASLTGIAVDDIKSFSPKLFPEVGAFTRSFTTEDPRLLSAGETARGRLYLQSEPTLLSGGNSVSLSLMISKAGDTYFRLLDATLNSNGEVVDIKILRDVPVTESQFQVRIGLIERLAVFEDAQNGIKMVFPIGVGAFDENIMGRGVRILTPLFSNAKIEKRRLARVVSYPSYFRGEAFLPITNAEGVETDIGLHITILSNAHWKEKGPNFLVRGFESHGCIRLRQQDLREAYEIVSRSRGDFTPIDIDFFVGGFHPYPVSSNSYQTVKNFSPPGQAPSYQRDSKYNLVILERVASAPDFSSLTGFDGDSLRDLGVFEGLNVMPF